MTFTLKSNPKDIMAAAYSVMEFYDDNDFVLSPRLAYILRLEKEMIEEVVKMAGVVILLAGGNTPQMYLREIRYSGEKLEGEFHELNVIEEYYGISLRMLNALMIEIKKM